VAETDELSIRPYAPGDADAFRSLNEEWISRYFTLEDRDRETLGDPEAHILRPGGHIFVARLGTEPVGCCALIPLSPGLFELSKMAVAPELRGRGIGRKILAHVIEQSRTLGAKSLFLASSTKLTNAVHLYESLGFRHLSPEERPPVPYQRASVFMGMEL
jgi:GNAT superfamily N-acetyltransferase